MVSHYIYRILESRVMIVLVTGTKFCASQSTYQAQLEEGTGHQDLLDMLQ